MRKKVRQITAVCLLSVLVIAITGCGLKKEVLLEHSGHEMELEIQQEETSDESREQEEAMPSQIYVYVCGQVANPGVYQVSEQARIFEAIDMAGGLTVDADPVGVNQAQQVTDGQMIYIPAIGELPAGSGTSLEGSGFSEYSKVNINTADLETLMSLPGIGQGKAQSILDYRQEHGSFRSIEEIMEVDGIKEGIYTKFKDKITI